MCWEDQHTPATLQASPPANSTLGCKLGTSHQQRLTLRFSLCPSRIQAVVLAQKSRCLRWGCIWTCPPGCWASHPRSTPVFHSEPLYLSKGTAIDCSTVNLRDSRHICTEHVPRQANAVLTLFLRDIRPSHTRRQGRDSTSACRTMVGVEVMGTHQSLQVTDENVVLLNQMEDFLVFVLPERLSTCFF